LSEARKREGGGRPNVQRAPCIVPAPVGAALCAALLPRSRRGENAARWLPRFQGGSRGGYRVCRLVFAVATALTSRRLARQFVCRLFSGYSTSAAVRARRFVRRLFDGRLPVICRARQTCRVVSCFALRRACGAAVSPRSRRGARQKTRQKFAAVYAAVLHGSTRRLARHFRRACLPERGSLRGGFHRARQRARQFGSSAANVRSSAAENAALCFERGSLVLRRGRKRGTLF